VVVVESDWGWWWKGGVGKPKPVVPSMSSYTTEPGI
jgi:hypothetical protein